MNRRKLLQRGYPALEPCYSLLLPLNGVKGPSESGHPAIERLFFLPEFFTELLEASRVGRWGSHNCRAS